VTSDSPTTPTESAPEQPASSYSGSPFHHSRYDGIRDAVRNNERRALREGPLDRLGRVATIGMVVTMGILGGLGGASLLSGS